MEIVNSLQITRKYNNSFCLLIAYSVVITLALFYIDEGFYNFNWMDDIGNWIAFFIYSSVISATEISIYWLIRNKYSSKRRTIISAILGTIIALFLLFFVIF